MIGGINVCNLNANPKLQSVQTVPITNPGAGYTVAPKIKFYGGKGGTGAAATSGIGDGVVGIVTLSGGGSGYTTAPTITLSNEVFLSGVSTESAELVPVVSAAGTISAIRITNAGLGYSTAPTITIGSPNMDSSGDFIFNEVVTGSTSGTTARVRTYNSTTNVLEVASVSGTFTIGEDIVGSTSGASHALRVIDTEPDNDPFADNFEIETQADNILDFSEQNPFGIP